MALNEIPLQELHAEAELKQPDLAYEDALADALVKWFKPVYSSWSLFTITTDTPASPCCSGLCRTILPGRTLSNALNARARRTLKAWSPHRLMTSRVELVESSCMFATAVRNVEGIFDSLASSKKIFSYLTWIYEPTCFCIFSNPIYLMRSRLGRCGAYIHASSTYLMLKLSGQANSPTSLHSSFVLWG